MPPVARVDAVPGCDLDEGRVAAGDHLGVEVEPAWRALGSAGRIGSAHRKAVDAGAVERRHVGRRRKVRGKHAVERVGERDRFRRQRLEVDRVLEAQARLLRRNHLEELLLARRVAYGGKQRVLRIEARVPHGSALTVTMAPAGKPSLAAGTRIQPSA